MADPMMAGVDAVLAVTEEWPTVADARLIARALMFTAGEAHGGTDVEQFDDDERDWMVRLGEELHSRCDAIDEAGT